MKRALFRKIPPDRGKGKSRRFRCGRHHFVDDTWDVASTKKPNVNNGTPDGLLDPLTPQDLNKSAKTVEAKGKRKGTHLELTAPRQCGRTP